MPSIWDQQITDHQEPGSFGADLQQILEEAADLLAQRPEETP